MKLPIKSLTSVLIKPSGPDCNLSCSYCFYLEKSSMFNETKTHRMSEKVLEETIEQVLTQSSNSVTIAWQGGEPTLLGLNFFEKAVEFEQKYGKGKTVGNSFQTNGILIDEKWADFFLKKDFLVGLSLDGPKHIHDYHRRYNNNGGTWDKVSDTAQLLLEKGVAVNTLVVVNQYSANYPDELYNYFKEIGINHMQFIPVVERLDANGTELADYSVSPEQFGKFLTRIFELWSEDFTDSGPATFIRFFDSVFYNYVNIPAPECELNPYCGNYLVIEHDGSVYSCDFFVEENWKLGNILEDKIIELLNSTTQTIFGNAKADLSEECINCNWLKYCYGGCTKHQLVDPRTRGLNYFCESYKQFFEYSNSKFTELANLWNSQNPQDNSSKCDSSNTNHSSQKTNRNELCKCGSGTKYKKCCGAV